ncbi:preprotein translocase subunit SecA [Candidatus Falkowbacteria bacterium]|jgi:preprotein translocase subunit SecA|nr:preprotein translocase subunit SecA [Candidatus Falkowbacteria bacterium]MBT6574251.1 preprotein translocase subunit SecA [Candidatus Falkowbacteria bacterium]MBT7348155.1 preprotein translocase subunit SecA [Candidatus Falkowbacteria bacterium]MBT7500784.1 preprotein translocase subunit SecA [Candidatus Falkowbacteria bacterium]
MKLFKKFFKDPNLKVIEEIQPIVDQVNAFKETYQKLTDEELKSITAELKAELKSGKTLDDVLPKAFAAVREANKRTLNVFHYDVQIVGGVVLHRGEIAEMKTGEGKTHVAALALYLNALEAKGVHLITVNDYLAKRDSAWNGAANHLLGLKTACLVHDQALIYDPEYIDEQQKDERIKHLRPCSRKEAYLADITYGTNSEYGFDYLRDNMVSDIHQKVQRNLNYAIVDEVDSVLIDEARTPLIISAPAEESALLYRKFAQLVPRLTENEDYNIDEKMRATTLTEEGIENIEKILGMGNIYTEGGIQMVHHLEQALSAHALFKKDKDYVVKDGEVVIIDEFTGRLMQGRRYSEGLHQAIEAKEGVEVQKESRTLATITIQNYFRMYKKLSGMTGTAATEAEEFAKIYDLDVTVVPTNRPIVRKDLPDRIYSSEEGRFMAVVREIKHLHESGQPVLVGTISIEKNELLASYLQKEGVPFELLNAKNHEKEAEIVSQAGRLGAVTVATNMAGRGVDIKLGGDPYNKEEAEKVKEVGGLFVLGTERHESRRIDNQLRGRSGRQGDPGASQFYISMEDDLMRIFGTDRVKGLMQRLGVPEDTPIENKMISNSIEKAQTRVEGHHFDVRKHLVEYDDVINKQRTVIYEKRLHILDSAKEEPKELRKLVLDMVTEELEQVISFHTAETDQSKWNLKEIAEVAGTIFPVSQEVRSALAGIGKISGADGSKRSGDKAMDTVARTNLIEYLVKEAKKQYEVLEAQIIEQSGVEDTMRQVEKEIMIRSIDNLWVDHLDAVSAVRTGIGLRGYGQRDPLIEFKKETYRMFMELQNLIQRQVVYSIYKVGITSKMTNSIMDTDQQQTSNIKSSGQFKNADPYANVKKGDAPVVESKVKNEEGDKVGRNDPCPCGSGKKYKKCCG